MTLVPDDFTFAESHTYGALVPYGTAGDCFSASQVPSCRKGSFKIDLTGTGLKLNENVEWILDTDTYGIEMSGFRNENGLVVSANCGGWCGKCQPKQDLKVEPQHCSQTIGKT